MGFWSGKDKKAAEKPQPRSANRGSQARGTYFDEKGDLRLAPIEELYDEDGRYRGPKGGRR